MIFLFAELCGEGEYFVDNICKYCPRGTYMNFTDHQLESCTVCPRNNATGRNSTTLYPGATEHSDCFYVSLNYVI